MDANIYDNMLVFIFIISVIGLVVLYGFLGVSIIDIITRWVEEIKKRIGRVKKCMRL